MILLAIDPATHGCGCAFFVDGVLMAAGYAPKKKCAVDADIVRRCAASAQGAFDWVTLLRRDEYDVTVDRLAVELPQIYSRGSNKTKGDPNKTALPMAMVDAALAALLPNAEVFPYQPHAWKGNTSKPKRVTEPEYVIIRRVKERLTPGEQRAIDWGRSVERSWDVADAIGVGLHCLGRFERARVFARD